MLWVYRALESHFTGSAAGRGGFAVTEWRRTLDLERDLQYWGVEPATGPAAATTRFVDQLGAWAESDPVALLGVLYVLEGSTNGSRFIAKSLRRAYPGADVGGMRFMDPYGESQQEHWRAFKAELDRVVASDAGQSLITAARATFAAVSAIGAELLSQVEGVGELDSGTPPAREADHVQVEPGLHK
jgi:heme oxygenase